MTDVQFIEAIKSLFGSIEGLPSVLLMALLLKKYVINGTVERYFKAVERRERYEERVLKTLSGINQKLPGKFGTGKEEAEE